MAQLTIYVDDETRRKIWAAAKQSKSSVSQWVSRKLRAALRNEWPEGYFSLFGSLRDGDLTEPSSERNAGRAE